MLQEKLNRDQFVVNICKSILITDMQSLLDGIQLKPKGKSKYQNKGKYESGRLIPVNDFLLLFGNRYN